MPLLEVFIFLQLLDVITTLIGFRVGAQEASPLMRWLMATGPLQGMVLGKAGACVLVGYCVWTRRHRVIALANYFFAALVIWNSVIILTALSRPH